MDNWMELSIAVFVRAIKDCQGLESSESMAYDAYNFLMDDFPWEIVGISDGCRDTVRRMLPDPAGNPNKEGYVQGVLDGFRRE